MGSVELVSAIYLSHHQGINYESHCRNHAKCGLCCQDMILYGKAHAHYDSALHLFVSLAKQGMLVLFALCASLDLGNVIRIGQHFLSCFCGISLQHLEQHSRGQLQIADRWEHMMRACMRVQASSAVL